MIKIFHLVYNNKLDKNKSSVAAFSIIAFCMIPKTSWIYAHNMLEIPLTFFTTLSVYFALMSMKTCHNKRQLSFGFLSGVAIGLSFLIKGPVGLFPLVSPFLFYFFMPKGKDHSGPFLSYFGISLALAVFTIFIIYHNPAYEGIIQYFKQQVIASLKGDRKNAERWFIFQKLFTELLPPGLVFYTIFHFLRKKSRIKMNKHFFFFLLLAIFASFPIALSDKQTSWYIFPSFPFYALAIASLFANPISQLIHWINGKLYRKKIVLALSGAMIFAAITSMLLDRNSIRRDADYYKDFILQELAIPEKQIVSSCPADLIYTWSISARMMRDHKATLTNQEGQDFLLVQNNKNCNIPQGCKKYHPKTSHGYMLYKCS